MSKSFDPTKPVQTRDGRPARILCADLEDRKYPIAAAYGAGGLGGEQVCRFTREGKYFHTEDSIQNHPLDLLNSPREFIFERLFNVYDDGTMGELHETRKQADAAGGKRRIACKRVFLTVSEGEGI